MSCCKLNYLRASRTPKPQNQNGGRYKPSKGQFSGFEIWAFFRLFATSPSILHETGFFQRGIKVEAIPHKVGAAKHVLIQLTTFNRRPNLKNQFWTCQFLCVFSRWRPNRLTFSISDFSPSCASSVPTFMIFCKFLSLQTSFGEPINQFFRAQKSFRSKPI